MKTRIIGLFLVLLLGLSLFSCKSSDEQQNNGQQSGTHGTSSSAALTIVKSADVSDDAISTLVKELTRITASGIGVKNYKDGESYGNNVLYVGNLPIELSQKAKKALERINVIDKNDVRYLLYGKGDTVALVFETDTYEVDGALNTAIENFVAMYEVSGAKMTLGNGVIASGVVNTIEYQRAKDEMIRDGEFASLYAQILQRVDGDTALAEDIFTSVKNLYSLYSDDMISWLANLYDPDTGGFYFSNSARDTFGYLPDIESTAQMLDIMVSSGLTAYSTIPTWLKDSMISFVKGLQHPNGYFYHPQWGKELTDSNIQRRSRDLSKAMGLFTKLGAKPTYDTPTGVKGDGILADGTPVSQIHLTAKLFATTSVRVSKVVATASFDYKDSYLESAQTFKAWLDTVPINASSWDSYYLGNALCTICAEIVERDRVLISQGQPGLVDVVEEWLGEKQNPYTGCWSPTFDIDAVNGLFKILSFYNGIKRPLPNMTAALDSTMRLLNEIEPEQVIRVCDIFNIWSNLDMIKDNVNLYGTLSEQKEVSSFYEGILKKSSVGLKKTVEILALFVREDGSMSYNPQGTCPTSQGMQVAVIGACEGDVNGTAMGTVGTTPPLMVLLGLTPLNIFQKGDRVEFFSILEEMDTIIKHPPMAGKPEDFEELSVDEDYERVYQSSFSSSEGGYSIVDRPDGNGKALLFKTSNDGYDYIYIRCDNDMLSATCYVFEADLMLNTSDIGAITQIELDDTYFFNLSAADTDGNGSSDSVFLYEQSTQNSSTWILNRFGTVAKLGEWFNLRLEFYPGTADEVRIKIIVNDEVIAVTDTYYGRTAAADKLPLARYNDARFIAPSTKGAETYIDNLLVTKTLDEYVPENIPEGDPGFGNIIFNVDSPEKDEFVYGFEGDGATDKLSHTEKGVSVEDGSLVLYGTDALATFPVNVRGAKTNCGFVEADIILNSENAVGTTYELLYRDALGNAIARFYLRVEMRNGQKSAVLADAAANKLGQYLSNIEIPVGEAFKLGIGYYEKEGVVLVYINGRLVSTTNKLCPSASGYKFHDLDVKVVTSSDENGKLIIDNLKVERIISSFAEATAPDLPEKLYTFESGMPTDFTANGNITVSGGKLTLSSADKGDSVTIPVNRRGETGNSVVFETLIDIRDKSASGNGFAISLIDTDEKIVAQYAIISRGDTVYVYESTDSKQYSVPMLSFSAGYHTFTLEYYPDNEIAEIFIDGVCMGRSSITYRYDESYGNIAEIKLTSLGASAFTFDDLKAEIYNKLYLVSTISATNAENESGTLTFDSSFTDNLPIGVRYKFLTQLAALRIKEHNVKGNVSKVLQFVTSAGGNDSLYFPVTKKDISKNAIAFEADMLADMKSTNDVFSIYFEVGNNHATRVTFKQQSDGTMVIYDDAGKVNFRVYQPYGEWFRLRLEYSVTDLDYNGDGAADVILRIFINGELCGVGYNTYNRSYTPSMINSVMIYSHSASDFTTYFDNVTVEHFDLNVAPHEHSYEDEWSYNEIEHWYDSSCSEFESCGSATKDKAPHDFTEGDRCICGYEKPAPHEHEYSDTYYFNTTNHWHKAVCDETEECKGLIGSLEAHDFDESGECVCGYKENTYPGDPDSGIVQNPDGWTKPQE